MKIAIILVMIPLAIIFLCIGFLICENKISFNDDGIVYTKGGVVKDANESDKDNVGVRKVSGAALIFCSVCMVVLPLFML